MTSRKTYINFNSMVFRNTKNLAVWVLTCVSTSVLGVLPSWQIRAVFITSSIFWGVGEEKVEKQPKNVKIFFILRMPKLLVWRQSFCSWDSLYATDWIFSHLLLSYRANWVWHSFWKVRLRNLTSINVFHMYNWEKGLPLWA